MYHATILRLEGAAIGAAALGAYVLRGDSWLLLAVLFLAPDLAMLALGVGAGLELAVTLGLIWTAHVGFDRTIGYGLKHADGAFDYTHLQRLAATPTELSTRSTPDGTPTAD